MTTPPGLDLRTLQGLRTPTRNLNLIHDRIAEHLDTHEGYLAFSGGKDSLVTLHLALHVAPDVPIAFFDSGLEFPETYTYLEALADSWHLNFHTVPARMSALEAMAANGSWDHRAAPGTTSNLHQVLITEPAAKAHLAHGPGELWGVRAEESRGRAAAYANALRRTACACERICSPREQREHHGGEISRIDGTVAYGPVWDWKTPDIWGYISRHQLPVNPVYTKLQRLGAPEHFLRVSAMLDGNRLEEGRVTWLRRGWPALFEELAVVLPRIREFV